MIFKRKKKKLENFNELGLINDIALSLIPFGEKITNSDVVLICIDRIASQCAKLWFYFKVNFDKLLYFYKNKFKDKQK